MELPWKKYSRIKTQKQELEKKLEKNKKQKKKYQKQLESEKERRSKLSTQKQEAEKKLKSLNTKINSLKNKNKNQETTRQNKTKSTALTTSQVTNILEKLGSIKSPKNDLATVYTTEGLDELEDTKGLKNTLSAGKISKIPSGKAQALFTDETVFNITLKTRPFFKDSWSLNNSFKTEKIKKFIQEEKNWVLVSAGETSTFKEQKGDIIEKDRITTRVENKQKKGGYSQDRFERKRQEQIQQHVKKTKDKIKNLKNIKLLGNQRMCSDLPGSYLGGFDSSKNQTSKTLYNFRLNKTNQKKQEWNKQ